MKKKSIIVWIVLIVAGAWALMMLYGPSQNIQQNLIGQRLMAGEDSDELG